MADDLAKFGPSKIGPGSTLLNRVVTTYLFAWAEELGMDDPRQLAQELVAIFKELAGPNPTPVVAMLAESAALSWFSARLHESRYVRDSLSDEGLTITQAKFYLTQIDRTNARLVSSLKAIAQVQKLAAPRVKVYIANNQLFVREVGKPFARNESL